MTTNRVLTALLVILLIVGGGIGVSKYRAHQQELRSLAEIPSVYLGPTPVIDLVPLQGTVLSYADDVLTLQQQEMTTSDGERFSQLTQRTMRLDYRTEIFRLSASSGAVISSPADRSALQTGEVVSVYVSAMEQSAVSPTALRIEILN